jgi:hypothetical protein
MSYNPKVNDYVKWSKGAEGWVYFKCSEYITIETDIRPKECENGCPLHSNYHVLILCYRDQWKDLTYIKSRQSVHETENNLETLGEGNR